MTTIKKNRNLSPSLNDVFFGNNWMDQFFDTASPEINHFKPDANIIEKESDFLITMALPGLTKKDIKLDLIENKLSVSGEYQKEEHKEGDRFVSREIRSGSFHREFKLGNHIDTEKIDATFKDGLLHITLPKSEKASPKTISIK